jgi:hypothetical protein
MIGGGSVRKYAAMDAKTDEHAGLWLTPGQLDSWLSVVR